MTGPRIEKVQSPAIGSNPDTSPAILEYFRDGRMCQRGGIKGIVIVVRKGSVVLVVATDSMGIGTNPEGAVGGFKNGPDKGAGQAVLIKGIVFKKGKPVGLADSGC